jgi:hypothetical protein
MLRSEVEAPIEALGHRLRDGFAREGLHRRCAGGFAREGRTRVSDRQ